MTGTPFVWYHNGRPLKDGLKSAGGLGTIRIHLLDGQDAVEGVVRAPVASRLEILRAEQADSGNYTCAPWRGTAASVSVFVSQGTRHVVHHVDRHKPSPIRISLKAFRLLDASGCAFSICLVCVGLCADASHKADVVLRTLGDMIGAFVFVLLFVLKNIFTIVFHDAIGSIPAIILIRSAPLQKSRGARIAGGTRVVDLPQLLRWKGKGKKKTKQQKTSATVIMFLSCARQRGTSWRHAIRSSCGCQ